MINSALLFEKFKHEGRSGSPASSYTVHIQGRKILCTGKWLRYRVV